MSAHIRIKHTNMTNITKKVSSGVCILQPKHLGVCAERRRASQISRYLHTYTYTHRHVHTRPYIHIYIHTYIKAYVHTNIHACIHTYTHAYTHAHMQTYIHTYSHTYILTYMQTYMFISVHAYIYTGLCAERGRALQISRGAPIARTYTCWLPPLHHWQV